MSKLTPSASNILDSCASLHYFKDKESFKTYSSNSEKIFLANGTLVSASGTGNVVVKSGKQEITFTNCLHVPDLTHNLVSLSQLYNKGCQVHNSGNEKFTVTKDGTNLFNGYISNGVFVLVANVGKSGFNSSTPNMYASPSHDAMLLHRRLGHLNFGYLKKLDSHLSCVEIRCPTCLL